MKISYNWLKQYIHAELTPERASEVLTSIGLEVESLEPIEAVPGGLKGVVTGEVLTCEKHPDADRLSLTTVNIGGEEPLQIVCGAPNVAAGQKVLVATVGAKLHPTEGEPFTIKKGKIRGAESNGMICAEDELGLGQSHAGILVLDASTPVGIPAAEALGLNADVCLEIGLTPNRTDAFSHYGVARDLAAALRNAEGKRDTSINLALPSLPTLPSMGTTYEVQVDNAAACKRYCGILLNNVKVAPSPKWLVDALQAIGQRSINNVVDITNFVQHEIGQPLHAFDAALIAGNKVVVCNAKTDEKFVTLDGVDRTLHADDLMICDAEKAMCIAGVFGGQHSGVTEATTSVFIESAWFDAVSVRKTARRHALNTDASFRFERGTDPNAAPWALKRCVQLLEEECGAQVASDMSDFYPTRAINARVHYSWKRAETLIGQAIPKDVTKHILTDLDICIAAESEDGMELEIPLYRVEVTREADVIEEVLRIYGYNAIAFPKGIRASLNKAPQPDPEAVQNKVADYLASRGFNEMMSMSLTKARYTELNTEAAYSAESAVQLLNPLSGDLAVMRQTLLFGGLEAVALNQNHRASDVRFFEFGKEYRKQGNNYHEALHLGLFAAGRVLPENWNNAAHEADFALIKGEIENIFSLLGVSGYQIQPISDAFFAEGLEYARPSKGGAIVLARWGRVKESLLGQFDVRRHVWYADLHWENVLAAIPAQRTSYKAPEKFPFVRRDLSLLVNSDVTFDRLEGLARKSERKLLREVGLFDVYEGKNLEAGKKSYALSFVLQDSTKTMTDEQVDQAMERILNALKSEAGAELRG